MPASVPLRSRPHNSQPTLAVESAGKNRLQLFLKRSLDITGAALLLILTAPLIAICGLLVHLQDGGTVIHRRLVIGKHREFNAFKLRTMRPDADEVLASDSHLRERFEVNFKLRDDPRVTRFGAFLRRTSFDELPQLWNVLRGEMSLVGPRIISPPELARYGEAAWIFKVMRPGLTGDWQVHAREATRYEQRVALDRSYVENWSLLNDLKILCKTPMRIVRGGGEF
jgi:lipopolysaccharide/colanic/teichoic acid biosynthesis glycosyltransferase